jgi:multiphosphoryl transfer protein
LHPAVLRLIAITAEAARGRSRRVSVCGGIASDPAATPILIDLGVLGLSAVPSAIPQLKALIRTLTIDACRALARRALEQESGAAVRKLTAELVG